MKRLFAFLLLSFLVNLSSNAQIQRKFYDFTLGETSKREVISYFKAKGIKIEKKEEDSYCIENLKFGGDVWSFASFMFYKDKLMNVYYSSNERDKGRALLAQKWENISNLIFKKYAEFKDLGRSSEDRQIFDDGYTSLTIAYDYFEGVKFVTISYYDIRLALEKIKQEENEF